MDQRSFLFYLLQLAVFRYISRYFGWFSNKKYYLLNQFKVAGYQYYNGDQIINNLMIGDELEINAEPGNKHDKNAVMISSNGIKIGYAPMIDNKMLSELLLHDMKLHCVVSEVLPEEDPWNRLTVQVFLEGKTFIAS